MEAVEPKSSAWQGEAKSKGKSEGKSEMLSLLVLGLCIAALVTILLIRPF
jgi:hypothetical protein